jgi:hypothetical protein
LESQNQPSRYVVETTDGHTYVVSFDTMSNPLVKETLTEIREKARGKLKSETLYATVDSISQPQKSPIPNVASMLSSIMYLMQKTGRSANDCKKALVDAKWSLEAALRLLSKKES